MGAIRLCLRRIRLQTLTSASLPKHSMEFHEVTFNMPTRPSPVREEPLAIDLVGRDGAFVRLRDNSVRLNIECESSESSNGPHFLNTILTVPCDVFASRCGMCA